jgi:hypothetical protein
LNGHLQWVEPDGGVALFVLAISGGIADFHFRRQMKEKAKMARLPHGVNNPEDNEFFRGKENGTDLSVPPLLSKEGSLKCTQMDPKFSYCQCGKPGIFQLHFPCDMRN